MGNIERGVRTYRDNFWSRKRIEQNIKISEVAEAVHLSCGIVGMYFTGQRMPTDETIKDICGLFDVDFLEGKREFLNANKAWDAQYSRKAVLSTNAKPKAVKKRKYTRRVETVTEQPQTPSDSVLEVLYGKLPQKAFRAILEGTESEIDPLEYLYDKVDFDDYMKIYNAMKEVK